MPGQAVKHVKSYPDHTRISVEFKKFYQKRTLPQNAYLHKIFGIIGAFLGYEDWEMKDHLKDMFLTLTPADDLEFRYGTNAPTLRIDALTVAGA